MKIKLGLEFNAIHELRRMARNKQIFTNVKDFYLDYNTKNLMVKYENDSVVDAEQSEYASQLRYMLSDISIK